jgi:enterochelin esterase-like enzyme
MHASAIRLDSTFGLTIMAVLALLAVIAVPLFWDKWGWKKFGRSATTLLAVVLVMVSSGLALNIVGGFFPTLGSLLGTSVNPGEGTEGEAGENGQGLARLQEADAQRAKEGKSSLLHMTVKGGRTGITRDVNLYLPPQYSDPSYRDYVFPVIEWIPNYPSGPEVAIGGYHLPEALDTAMGKGLLPPSVVIIPDPSGNPRVGHDSECVDEVNGHSNDTYLSADIRNWALHTLHVNPDRKAWTLAGWSSGGYCALNIAARHPQWYATAASVSGYDKASIDAETEDLYRGRKDISDANTVSLNLAKHPSPLDLLVIAGSKEHDELASIDTIRKAIAPPTVLYSWVIPDAGHNMNTFKSQLPQVLSWIGSRSAAPRPSSDQQVAASGGVRPWPLPHTGGKGALADLDS